jgi:twitching motility protein PilT
MSMQTLEKALADLVIANQVTMDEALSKTTRPEELKRLISHIG